LARMRDGLLDALTHLLTQLEPVVLPSLATGAAPLPKAADPAAVAAVQEAVQPVFEWLTEPVGLVDLSAVQEQVGGVAGQAQALAEGIEQKLTGVTIEVQALFEGLRTQL